MLVVKNEFLWKKVIAIKYFVIWAIVISGVAL